MYKKIAIKIGSNVLTTAKGELDEDRMAHLVDQIAMIKNQGVEVILISSGAMAVGRKIVEEPINKDTVALRQLWSATGQVQLINTYSNLFEQYDITCAQVLTTKGNFKDRRHYLNMKNCMSTLLENGIIPIVNENDTISLSELMFTDNDELAGLMASMMDSEALVILSNVDGIYDGDPESPETEVISEFDPDVELGDDFIVKDKSNFGRGGMITKIGIAQKAAKSGVTVYIANGHTDNILMDMFLDDTTSICTKFLPSSKDTNVRKWLSFSDGFEKGEIVVDDGAVEVLRGDKPSSILLIGVVKIIGEFNKSDIIKIKDNSGDLIGFGKAQYDSSEAQLNLGESNYKPLVHYNYLYLHE